MRVYDLRRSSLLCQVFGLGNQVSAATLRTVKKFFFLSCQHSVRSVGLSHRDKSPVLKNDRLATKELKDEYTEAKNSSDCWTRYWDH